MRQGFIAELSSPTTYFKLPAPNATSCSNNSTDTNNNINTNNINKTGSVKKFQIKLRRSGPPIDGSELRVSHKSIVRMTNVDAIISRFEDLISRLPASITMPYVDSSAPSPAKPTPPVMSSDGYAPPPVPPRKKRGAVPNLKAPIMLTIVAARDIPVVRPFSTKLSFRITSPSSSVKPNYELGRTHKFSQPVSGISVAGESWPIQAPALQSVPVLPYDEHDPAVIPLILSEREMHAGLQISLIHHVNPVVLSGRDSGGGEFVVATAQLKIDAAAAASLACGDEGTEDAISVSIGGGSVIVRVCVDRRKPIEIAKRRVLYSVRACVWEMRDAIAEKVYLTNHVFLLALTMTLWVG